MGINGQTQTQTVRVLPHVHYQCVRVLPDQDGACMDAHLNSI